MVKHRLTKPGSESCTCFCGKELGCNTDSQTGSSHEKQDKKASDNDAAVIFGNSHIDHMGDHNGNHKVRYNFQKLEKRSQYGLLFVVF